MVEFWICFQEHMDSVWQTLQIIVDLTDQVHLQSTVLFFLALW
jgi:hypothetical protein